MAVDVHPVLEAAGQEPRTNGPAPTKSAKTFLSYSYLHELMKQYQVKDLVTVDAKAFMQQLEEFQMLDDPESEGFVDASKQNPVTVRFHWGHRHNFGEFSKPGRMGNHHIAVLATFIDELGAIPRSLKGMKVLDIGCWTGGTSLLLCAMGAEVVAVEEIKKYADCVNFLKFAFDVRSLGVRCMSLYDCTTDEFQDAFDLVLFPGVLHHLSDPKLALRITFNCLKDGGKCLVETLSYDFDPRITARRASAETRYGTDADEAWGWNWLLFTAGTLMQTMRDVGFVISHPCTVVDNRTFVVGERDRHVDMRRAGLSVRNIR